MADGPLAAYRALRSSGKLQPDPAQAAVAEKLQSLHNALKHYQPAAGRNGWRARLGFARRQEEEAPQGLYIFGGVGRGKSMLMDLFFETAPVAAKRRVHFHAFMLEVHQRLDRLRRDGGNGDIVPQLAREMASEAWLLCLDEFHVRDIADAMILGRLFSGLFENGVVAIATSNFPPDDLYRGGLQRERFLPFIDLIKQRLDVIELDGGVDHRQGRLRGLPTYHMPIGAESNRRLAQAFAHLTDGADAASQQLDVQGRSVTVPRAAKGVAWFSFDELCGAPLGAADYLAIATRFHTLILGGVPVMSADLRNEARRFITLIDVLYDRRVALICSADAAPSDLCAGSEGAFEFQRTASRLIEMQSQAYLAQRHLA
jgi:cell division protein ZapE